MKVLNAQLSRDLEASKSLSHDLHEQLYDKSTHIKELTGLVSQYEQRDLPSSDDLDQLRSIRDELERTKVTALQPDHTVHHVSYYSGGESGGDEGSRSFASYR